MGLSHIEKAIPGVRWLRGYNIEFALCDLIAGITVGLTLLPQGLAYATLAGLPPQYGLYSAFMGGMVYACMGGCPEVNIGPTALLSLMTSRHTGLGGASGPHLAILLCLLSGVVELMMALLRLGSLVDLLSIAVIAGFTSATAIIICCSQLKALLGITAKSSGSGFLSTIYTVFTNLHTIRYTDAVLGISSIFILLAVRKMKDIKTPENASKTRRLIGGAIWFFATARNALLVFGTSFFAFISSQNGNYPFILTGTVKSGIPTLQLPPMETTRVDSNGTMIHMDFGEMVSELGASIVLVPIIAVLGNVAISKAFGGNGIDPTRELVALSLSNVFGSFFQSYPVTGSFSRSAVNHASGVKTPIGGIYTGFLVLLALSVLTPYFQYIPKATLGAVIISAVIFMIEYEVIRPLWRCSRRELLPGAVTFILSLLVGVEIGLLAGVAVDVAFLVHRAARPNLMVERCSTITAEVEFLIIRPRYSLLYFPATEYIRIEILNATKKHRDIPIVLDCRNLHEFDFTAARGLGGLYKELQSKKVSLVLLGPSNEIEHVLKEAIAPINIPSAHSESDLENALVEITVNKSQELKDVAGTPLLTKNSEENDVHRRKSHDIDIDHNQN